MFDFNGKVIAIHSRVSSQPDEVHPYRILSCSAEFSKIKLFTLESLEQGGFWEYDEERLNGLEILEVIEDTPAYQAGLLAGDIIKQVDSIKIKTGKLYYSYIGKIRGAPRLPTKRVKKQCLRR